MFEILISNNTVWTTPFQTRGLFRFRDFRQVNPATITITAARQLGSLGSNISTLFDYLHHRKSPLTHYGIAARTSSRKLAGDGMSPSRPHTSTISSTDVAGERSFWKVV